MLLISNEKPAVYPFSLPKSNPATKTMKNSRWQLLFQNLNTITETACTQKPPNKRSAFNLAQSADIVASYFISRSLRRNK